MEDFNVIQAIVRTSLTGNRDATLHQVERLANSLSEQGEDAQARTLRTMVTKARKTQAAEPFDVVSSSTANRQEVLGLRTALPVDRESGAPLCEVIFPVIGSRGPVVDDSTRATLERLLDEWRQPARLEDAGLPVATGLLLYGPPGTGKTTLALHLASVLQKPAVVARLDGLISSLLGNTARNLGALFDFCNRYDVVLILDEFDAVAKVRDDRNEVGEIKRVVNTLLQNLDRRIDVGITIGITNHEHLLDSAIWRRFEHQVQLELPSEEMRREIAQTHLRPSEYRDGLVRVLGWSTAGLSGAETRSLTLAVMKTLILSQEFEMEPVSALRAAISSARNSLEGQVVSAFNLPDQDLGPVLLQRIEGLSVGEVANVFGRDRRTVSRWQVVTSA